MTNPYIQRIENMPNKEEAVNRGKAMVCSWTLGRDFNETCDSFFARHSMMAEFIAWFERFQTDKA